MSARVLLGTVLPFRRRALALVYLIDRGYLDPRRPLGPQLIGLGFTRSTARRWAHDYRRWDALGRP